MPSVEEFEPIISYLRDKLPQLGFFSTLDDAVKSAPFEKASPEQWKNYLKPGLTIQRQGVSFPLKAEELHYAELHPFLNAVSNGDPTTLQSFQDLHNTDASEISPQSISKRVMREQIQRTRPGFNLDVRMQDNSPYGDGVTLGQARKRLPEIDVVRKHVGVEDPQSMVNRQPTWHHDAQFGNWAYPSGVPGSYEENITTSPDFGVFKSHFTPRDISWSRTSRHLLNPEDPNSPTARLVDEIQSDRHAAAAKKTFLLTPGERAERQAILNQLPGGSIETTGAPARDELINRLKALEDKAMRRPGYRTSEEEQTLTDNPNALNTDLIFNKKPPDTPFKSAADYGLLELKKQLINAVHQGDSYLALSDPQTQIERYGSDPDRDKGMQHIYGQVYPAALEKLARMYGGNVEDLPIRLKDPEGAVPVTFSDVDANNVGEYIQKAYDGLDSPSRIHEALNNLLGEFREKLPPSFEKSQLVDQAKNHLAQLQKTEPDDVELEDPDRFYSNEMVDHRSNARAGLQQSLEGLHKLWTENNSTIQKSFPALKITPELRQRVQQAGVPLFKEGGMVRTHYAGGGSTSPLEQYVQSNVSSSPSSNDGYLNFLVRAQAMGMGLPPADTIFDPIPGMPVTMAEGGAVADQGPVYAQGGPTGPLGAIARGIESGARNPIWGLNPARASSLARLATRLASQLYGLGPHGHPVFMGWLNPTHWGQKGFVKNASSPKIVQEALSVPDQMVRTGILLRELAKKYAPAFMLGSHHPTSEMQAMDPRWSQEASNEVGKIDSAVDQASGLGHAKSLAGILMNMSGDIGPLMGLAHTAEEGSVGRHLLNEIAGWGGGGAGQQESPPSQTAPHLSQADLAQIFSPPQSHLEPDLVQGH